MWKAWSSQSQILGLNVIKGCKPPFEFWDREHTHWLREKTFICTYILTFSGCGGGVVVTEYAHNRDFLGSDPDTLNVFKYNLLH